MADLTFVTCPEGDWLVIQNEGGAVLFSGHKISPRELLILLNCEFNLNLKVQTKEISDEDMYMEKYDAAGEIEDML